MTKRSSSWYQRSLLRTDAWSSRLIASLRPRVAMRSAPDLCTLEKRLLFSATPLDPALVDPCLAEGSTDTDVVAQIQSIESSAGTSHANSGPNGRTAAIVPLDAFDSTAATTLIFVDSSVADLDTLLDGLRSDRPDADVFVLSASDDGVETISQILDGRSGIESVHLISHAEDGAIKLGSTHLSGTNLAGYAGRLAGWGAALSDDADLLIYGCDLATDDPMLVESLAALTGADVAASTDDTGHADYDANWTLEYTTGVIDSAVVVDPGLADAWNGKLNLITVTTFADVLDVGDGLTSLREAIGQANAGGGGDVIQLAAGTYTLTRSATIDSADVGDLDITLSTTILGDATGITIIDASGLTFGDRVIEVLGGETTLKRVVLTGGREDAVTEGGGGAIRVSAAGSVRLQDVEIGDNESDSRGGAIEVLGSASLQRVTLAENVAGGDGGGIYFDGSSLDITQTTISGNLSGGRGGGMFVREAATIRSSTIAMNASGDGAAGIHENGGATVSVSGSILLNPSGQDSNGSITDDGNNLAEDAAPFGSATPALELHDLAQNGGFVRTHALPSGSPAIDSVPLADAPITDARGIERFGVADIGAYEASPPLFLATGEIRVNQTTADDQTTYGTSSQLGTDLGAGRSVAADAQGNYVVVWTSEDQDGDDAGVFGRRFDATGVALGNEFQVNVHTADDQNGATVAMNASGEFIVSWTSEDQFQAGSQVIARRFAADGTPLAEGEILISGSQTDENYRSSVGLNDDGQFAVAWNRWSGDESFVLMRSFDSDANYRGTLQTIDSRDSTILKVNDPKVTLREDGTAILIWENFADIRYQLIGVDGTPSNAATKIAEAGASSQTWGSVDVASDGGFVITWTENADEIHAQRFDANANLIGGRITVNETDAGTRRDSVVSVTDDGGFVVTWTLAQSASESETYVRSFDSNGDALTGDVLVNQTGSEHQRFASVAAADTSNFVVVYSGNGGVSGQVDDAGVFVRQYGTYDSNPVDVTVDNDTIVENTDASSGYVIGRLSTVDADHWGLFDYEIVATADYANFSIDADKLVLTDSVVDFETKSSYEVRVRSTDHAANWFEKTLTISVLDQPTGTVLDRFDSRRYDNNDGSVNFAGDWQELGESDGPVAGSVQIESSTNSNAIEIEGAGESIDGRGFSRAIDLDDASAVQLSYQFRRSIHSAGGGVRVEVSGDGGGNWQTLSTIHLTANDPAFVAGDHDISAYANATTQIRVVGFGSNVDALIQFDDVTIAYEADSVNQTISPITNINPDGLEVAEDVGAGATVGVTAQATDPDTPGAIEYTLSDDADGRFAIGINSGVVTVVGGLDFEDVANRSHEIVVVATSPDGSMSAEAFEFQLTDANDNAPVVIPDGPIEVQEGVSDGTTLAIFTATDADLVATISNWMIVSGNDDGAFAIDSGSGQLSVADGRQLDFETDASRTIEVRVSDGSLTSAAQTFTINVLDVVENDTIWLSTERDVIGSTNPDLTNWNRSQALQFGGVGLTTDSVTGTTAGTLGVPGFDLANFTTDDISIEAMHFVGTDLSVGTGGNSFSLRRGDLLLAVGENGVTMTSAVESDNVFDKDDLFVFRPQSRTDYGTGNFYHLLSGPGGLGDIDGISLVESSTGTTVGDVTLDQGTFILVGGSSAQHNRVFSYWATDVGPVLSDGTLDTLIDGDDSGNLGVVVGFNGVHLVSHSQSFAGAEFVAGDLLLTVFPSADIAGVESNRPDAVRLRVSETAAGGGDSVGAAELFFDGEDVGFMNSGIDYTLSSLTLTSTSFTNGSIGPITDANAAPESIDEDAAINSTVGYVASAVDPDAGDTITYSLDQDAGGRFAIDPATGVLRLAQTIDFEVAQDHNLIVRATSSDGTFRFASVLIRVQDVNERGEPRTFPDEPEPSRPVPLPDPVAQNAAESPRLRIESENAPADAPENRDSTEDHSGTDSDEQGESESNANDSARDASSSQSVAAPGPLGRGGWADPDAGPSWRFVNATTLTSQIEEESLSRSLCSTISFGGGQSRGGHDSRVARGPDTFTEGFGDFFDGINDQSAAAWSRTEVALLAAPGKVWDALDQNRRAIESTIRGDYVLTGTAGAAASSLTIGVLAWTLRSGLLVSGFLAQLPAWRGIDPLLVMQGGVGGGDGETLEQMMDRHNQSLSDPEPSNAAADEADPKSKHASASTGNDR